MLRNLKNEIEAVWNASIPQIGWPDTGRFGMTDDQPYDGWSNLRMARAYWQDYMDFKRHHPDSEVVLFRYYETMEELGKAMSRLGLDD